jgi:hypothetical protein
MGTIPPAIQQGRLGWPVCQLSLLSLLKKGCYLLERIPDKRVTDQRANPPTSLAFFTAGDAPFKIKIDTESGFA